MSLERRYRLLLRAYPPAYRAARGAEITGTYLDLAGPGRRWPAPGDVADVLRGGLRERLRASGARDAAAGVRLAATVALAASAALAIWQLLLRSLPGQALLTSPGMVPPRLFGPFVSVSVVPDAVWVLAAVAAVARPARVARVLVGAGLVLTLAAVPFAYLTDHVPPRTVVFPQLALGLVALALPARRGRAARLAPGLTVVAATGICLVRYWLGPERWRSLAGWGLWHYFYPGSAASGEQQVALALVAGTFLVGCTCTRWRDSRWLWAALTLLTPAALLWLLPAAFPGGSGGPRPWLITLFAAVIAAMTSAVIPLALKLTARANSPGRCTACGQPLPPRAAGPPQHWQPDSFLSISPTSYLAIMRQATAAAMPTVPRPPGRS
jgi:hypothetical protein